MDIKIPKYNNLDCNWDNLLRTIHKSGDIRIDLSSFTFLRPEIVIMLIVLSQKIHQLSSQPVEWINLTPDVHSYLERLDVNHVPFINIPPVKTKFIWNRAKNQSNNLMELKTINNTNELVNTIKHIKDILSKHFPEKISSGFCKVLPSLISEIVGNSLEHSEKNHKGKCYFLAQKYEGKGGKNVVIAFGDCGIGIRGSLQMHNPWLANNDVLALKKAFLEGVTARADKSGGLGFQQIRKELNTYKGKIIIRSGRGVISYNPNDSDCITRTKKFCESLPGTQTVLIL